MDWSNKMKIFRNALFFIGLLIGSMLLIKEIYAIRITKITDQFGPRLLPTVLCVFIFVLSSLLVVFSKKSTKLDKIDMKSSIYALVYYVAIIVYILSMRYLGFVISSLVFVELSVLLLGGKIVTKKIYVFFCLLITVVIVYCLFEYILHMNLPKGLILNGVF